MQYNISLSLTLISSVFQLQYYLALSPICLQYILEPEKF